MIRLTFKNVGQGDSIILEWVENGQNKICIIDCNRFNDENPVLDHIIQNEYKVLDYLILSHPHFDHFSGFLQLLEHCKASNIKIQYFLHTCNQVPSYLKAASRSAETERELQRLFFFLFDNHKKMSINVAFIQGGAPNSTIIYNKQFTLKILSPTLIELNNYVRNSKYPFNEEESTDNPKANLISTIIKIENENYYTLLTSDADKSSLIRIDKNQNQELIKCLLIGQVPHHGAFCNHNNTFWKKRNRFYKTAMVISTGPNSYDHPSEKVMDFFLDNGFSVYSTSNAIDSRLNDIVPSLDVFSYHDDLQSSNNIGDQIFVFDNKEFDYKHIAKIN
jgi:beta-lactamase superfamily II metal-dependent hydrolase